MENNSKSKLSDHQVYFSTDHLKTGLKTRALRGASITVAAQACTYGIGTVGTIIVARLLSPHDFGLVTMVLAFSILLQSIASNGFFEAAVQKKEIHHRQISTLFWINAGFGLILTLFFIVSAPVIAWFYNEPILKPIVVAMAVSIQLAGLSNQHRALLTRSMQFFKTSAIEVVAAFISVTISIVLAYRGWGYWALVMKWVISPLVITGGAWILCGWRPGSPARGTGVRPLLKFILNATGNFAIGHFRRNVDKILIGRFQGVQSLGHYDRAYHLSLMLPNQLIAPLNGVSIATFSKFSDDPVKYRHYYLKVLSILAFVCMPLSAVMTLIGKDLILLLLGPQWKTAGELFAVFGVSTGVMMLYITHSWIHLSLGTTDRWFRWGIVAIIVTVLLFVIGLPFGAIGVAIAYSASYYILIVPALWYAGRPIHLKITSVLSVIWKDFISALAAGLLSWFILYENELLSNIFRDTNIFARMTVSVILCIFIYLFLIVSLYQSTKPISQFISVLRDTVRGQVSKNHKSSSEEGH